MKYLKEIEVLQDKARVLKAKMRGESNRMIHSKLEDQYFQVRAEIASWVRKGRRS